MPWRSHLGRPTTVACDVLGLAELEKLRGSGTAYYPPTMLLGGFWFCPLSLAKPPGCWVQL